MDPLLQMIANAVVHTLTLGAIVVVLGYGPYLVPIGLALLLTATIGVWRRRSNTSAR